MTSSELAELRGGRIGMVFQDPMTFLNPVYTAGEQVAEAIRRHQHVSRKQAKQQAIDLFRTVGIPDPVERYDAYPHQLSGGMRQRVMIAIALSSRPELLIADEPTTALDVTIQAQILDLLSHLRETFGMSVLLISHDLGVIAEMCDRVAVMYAGRIVEQGPAGVIFEQPEHPYTIGLINAVPRPDLSDLAPEPIPGNPPDLVRPPAGCSFHPRCPWAVERCKVEAPELRSIATDHVAACHFSGTGTFGSDRIASERPQ
jgi:oligopeptide/dipeptide ABC transporter ATP-binding protein